MKAQPTVNMTDLARRLGVQVHRVHYLVQTGRIPRRQKRQVPPVHRGSGIEHREVVHGVHQARRRMLRKRRGITGGNEMSESGSYTDEIALHRQAWDLRLPPGRYERVRSRGP